MRINNFSTAQVSKVDDKYYYIELHTKVISMNCQKENAGGDAEYLIAVDYLSDAERKRIDYTIERWKEKAHVSKTRGTMIWFSGGDVGEFVDDLYSRLSAGREAVRVFTAEEYQPDVEEQVISLKYISNGSREDIINYVDAVIKKHGASYDGVREGIRFYTAYTRKGQVSMAVSIRQTEQTIWKVSIVFTGFGNAALHLQKRIASELSILLGDDVM